MDEDEKLYLTNKHRGGESGRRGNLYEAYYAVFAIFREIANGNDSTIVSGQVEDAYVDDLLISDGTTNVYHQLKNKKNPSWGSMKHGDLKYDLKIFNSDRELCAVVKKLRLAEVNREDLLGESGTEAKLFYGIKWKPAPEESITSVSFNVDKFIKYILQNRKY